MGKGETRKVGDKNYLGAWGQFDPGGYGDARRFQQYGGTEDEYNNLSPEQQAQYAEMLRPGGQEGQTPNAAAEAQRKAFVQGIHGQGGAAGAAGAGGAGAAGQGGLYAQLLAQSADAGKFETEQRLNPTWDNRENAMRARLLNQGLDPTSEASQNAMGQFGRDRNDAYASALNASQDSRYRNALNTWIADTNAKMGFANGQQQQLADLLGGAGSAAQAGVNALSKWKPSPADGTQPIGYDASGTPYYSDPSEWDNPFPYSGG